MPLNYPLQYSGLTITGPTLFYIDQDGTPIQMGLSNEQVQIVLDDWNTATTLESEIGEPVTTLKPPCVLS